MSALGEPRTLAEGFSFLEGPRWHDGWLFASDMYTRRVLRFSTDGPSATVCGVPGRPSGLGWDQNGHLLVASMQDRRLLRYRGGKLEQLADLARIADGYVNDMIVDGQGRAYIGNFGASEDDRVCPTALIRVDPDGGVSIAAEELCFPNGMAFTDEGRTLLVAETFAFRISAFDIADDGTLSGRREWARLGPPLDQPTVANTLETGFPLPDGICVDVAGKLWVGDAGGRGALRIAEGGEVLDQVDTGELTVYAVELGGDDGHTLFLCCASPLLRVNPMVVHRSALLACEVDVGRA